MDDHNFFLRRLLIVLFSLSLLIRILGLTWGDGLFFHPDENNMARSIVLMEFPKLDPQFYAYGQLSLFLVYFPNLILGRKEVNFNQAVYGLRLWSAIFSTLTIVIGYLLAKSLFKKEKLALLYAFLLAFTPGLIQQAHFGTTESILTFVLLSLTYVFYKTVKKEEISLLNIFLMGLLAGMGLATKISAGIFILPIFIGFIIILFINKNRSEFLVKIIIFVFFTILFFFLFSPFYFLKWQESLSVIKYETQVATGKILVFYTRQFFDTMPIIFQLSKIFPWAMGLPMFLLFIFGLVIFLVTLPASWHRRPGLLIRQLRGAVGRSALFLGSFISQAGRMSLLLPFSWLLGNVFLFVKWTRFITPLLPFSVLLVVYFFDFIEGRLKRPGIIFFLLLFTILPGIIFLKIYLEPDIRIRATKWMNENLTDKDLILAETGNVIDLPILNTKNFQVINFDFYQLEEDQKKQEELATLIQEADYFLLPSRRVFANHSRKRFPKTYEFYQQLFSGNLGFVLLKEFKVFNRWEEILLGSDLSAEETWTVFDHPTIRLYKKMN